MIVLMYSKIIRTVLVASIAISLAGTSSLMFFSNQAAAQLAKKELFGVATTGSLICLDMSTHDNVKITQLSETKIKGVTTGFLGILDQNIFGFKQGVITGGKVLFSKQSYNLQGLLQSDTICNSGAGATFSVSGLCGAGVLITFVANDGEKATFTGNVACVA